MAGASSEAGEDRRWAVLALLGVAQLMVVLDATIVSWRWCLYVNLLIALPTVLVALRLLQNLRPQRRAHIDIPGLLLVCGGLFAIVYGFSNAETQSWTTALTIIALAGSVVLLAAFLAVERHKANPLLPLHIVRDRSRGGAYLSIALAGAGVFAVFLFLTYYMQQNLGFSPVKTGLSFLPMTAVLVVTSTTVQTRVLYRTGAKPLVAGGMTLALIAMLLLTRLTPGAGYASHVLPSLLIVGAGIGCIFAPAFSTAKRRSPAVAEEIAVDDGAAIAARAAAPAIPVSIAGPCSHFGMAGRSERVTLLKVTARARRP
jgi:MFS family permease